MGNNYSSVQETDWINIDALSITKYNQPLITSDMISERYEKQYVIYQRNDGYDKQYLLTIKMIDMMMFIYCTDYEIGNSVLVHVINLNNTYEPKMLIRYIQISSDFRLISLPEENQINVYDLKKLVCDMKLYLVSVSGIRFKKLDKKINMMIDKEFLIVGEIDQYDQSENIVKCMLFNGSYCIMYTHPICKNNHNIKMIDYIKKTVYNINNLEISSEKMIKFSTLGKYMMICQKNGNNISCSSKSLNIVNNMISNEINKRIDIFDLIDHMISDDGKFLFYVTKNGKLSIVTNNKQSISLDFDMKITENIICGSKFFVVSYDKLSGVGMTDNVMDIYLITGWNRVLMKICYWILISDRDIKLFGPWIIEINMTSKIEYLHTNPTIYLYRSLNEIMTYDLNKIIPIRLVQIMANQSKSLLIDHFQKMIKSPVHRTIRIVGADESIKEYLINEGVDYLFTIPLDESNLFDMDIPVNINIHSDVKSFNIFIGLISGSLGYLQILNGLMEISNKSNQQMMFGYLIEHMIEYTRIFIHPNDPVRSYKQIHCAYILMILIFKYYLMFQKGSFSNKNNSLYIDIIMMFLKEFPVFREFVNQSFLLMGTSEKMID